jgi:glycerate dehydrogenase
MKWETSTLPRRPNRTSRSTKDELIAFLEEGLIRGAGLDVTTTEPPAADSKLWDLPNVWLSPHTGWRRLETRQRLVDMTCDNIASFCEAQTEADILNVVN